MKEVIMKEGISLKNLFHKNRVSKYKRFLYSLLFAVITIVLLSLCYLYIIDGKASDSGNILLFATALLSLLIGLYVMLHNNTPPNEN